MKVHRFGRSVQFVKQRNSQINEQCSGGQSYCGAQHGWMDWDSRWDSNDCETRDVVQDDSNCVGGNVDIIVTIC